MSRKDEERRSAPRRRSSDQPTRRIAEGSQSPLARALELLVPESKKVLSEWHRLLRHLALSSKDREALEGLARPDLEALSSEVRTGGYESFVDTMRRQGGALATRGVPEDQAVAGFALYLESALARLLDRTPDKAMALALVRLTGEVQRSLVLGYAASRAAGWQRADDQERLRLSRDLHDEIGADLVVLKLCLETITKEAEGERWDQMAPRLDEALALIGRTLDSVRRLALDLGPAVLEQIGFLPALRLYCRQFATRTGIDVQIQEADLPERLPPNLELALYRVLQGALSNVLRHARAKTVKVRIGSLGETVLVMTIEDDGLGFNVAGGAPSGGFGLSGMRDRIESLGGRLHVESRPIRSSGTKIELDLPLQANRRP